MARKKKSKSVVKKFFFTTRLGFYTLAISAVFLMLAGINLYGSANFESSVLGEDDYREEKFKNEDQKHEEEQRRETKKQEEEQRKEAQKQKIEQKYEVNSDKLKLEYQYESDTTKIKRKVESKDGEIEIEEEIEEELGDDLEEEFELENEVEIASGGGEVTIKKQKIKARTGFPLSIDLATNQLIVTRPDGTTKAVAVLPDKAVENFMRHKKINLINFEDQDGTPSAEPGDNTGTESAENTEDETQISLIEKDDELVYKIQGKKKLKLLGLFPITTPTTGYVSAETGEVVDQEEPLITKIFDFLSP